MELELRPFGARVRLRTAAALGGALAAHNQGSQ